MQRLERSPTRAELAAEVNKTEAQLTQIQKLGQLAKQKMITANLRLVVAVAKKCRWSNLEFLDRLKRSHSKVRSAHGQGMKALRGEQDQIKDYLVS
ncbi:hypothetical protein [Komarekiella delphini-convector]|uniref:hypothetical protein n=1 Tax=Komarekiella delphini-convector TaxID=3050158 RepID=UPI001CD89245|nr:hypothetical protein [Komarekiella delphini-convector]